MEQEQFIGELFDLSAATRRLARTLADPAVTPRLGEIADELDELARTVGQVSPSPPWSRLAC